MKHTFFRVSLLASLTTACAFGPKVADYPTATGPNGASISIMVADIEYIGELYEVRDDALVILSQTRVEHALPKSPRSREVVVRRILLTQIKSAGLAIGSKAGVSWATAPATRERFRLLSRFPQGIPPELLPSILKTFGQTAIAGGLP